MKKNFFKKLSFVLALAMIVSIIAPAAGAFAATSPKLSASSKTLLLGQDGRDEYDFNVKNKVAGSAYKWSSDKESVAVVDETGVTSAVGTGKATISVVITKKGAKAKTLKATVTVKSNAKTVTITNKPEGDKVAVGAEWTFGSEYVTFSGAKTGATSVTKFAVVDATGAAVTTATISDAGVFKATAAGKYTVVAAAFQSNAKVEEFSTSQNASLVLATDTYEVTVANDVAKVEQIDGTSAKITFTSAMDSVKTADLTVSSLISSTSTKIKQTIKSITLSADKTTATVVMYATFASGTTYVFDYTGMKSAQFVGATANATDVVDMVISTTEATVNAAKDISVKLLNANGVDIASINKDLLTRVTIKSSSEKLYLNTSVIPNQITMYNVGDTTTLTAVYHTYKYDTTGTETGAITKTGTVTCVSVAANPFSSIANWTLALATATAPTSFTTVNHVIAAEDAATQLYVDALSADGKTHISNANYCPISAGKAFKFESSDPTVLIVNPLTGVLYPVKAGAANVVVSYCDDTTATNKTYTVLGAIEITVSAKRVATALNLGATDFTLSNSTTLLDSKSVSIEVLDQYGVKMPADTVTVTELPNSLGGNDPIVAGNQGSVTSIVFNGTYGGAAVKAGAYTYSVTTKGLTRYVNITISEPSSNVSNVPATSTTYKFKVDSTYDAKITTSAVSGTSVNIKVIGYAKNGVALESLNTPQLGAATTGSLAVKLYKADGTEITSSISGSSVVAGVYAVSSISGGSVYVQVPTGTYTLKLYNTTAAGVTTLFDLVTFTVTNTQAVPAVTVNQYVANDDAAGKTLAGAIVDCFTVKDSAGNTLTPYVVAGDYTGDGSTGTYVFVKNIRVDETINGYTLTHVIAVNANILVK